jgi:hypothetical protein
MTAARRRPLLVAVAALVASVATLALLEVSARLYWRVGWGIPLARPRTVLCALYPELWDVEWKDRDLVRAGAPSILLLGGSALHPQWGNVEQELRERLTAALRRPVAIVNMAAIGHTSRDSYIKYRALAGRHFDLVVFYHGINDTRANNAPPEVFRPDYSHYAWYASVDVLDRHRDDRFVLPYTVEFLAIRARDRLGLVRYVPMDAPRAEWLPYGRDIKSAAAFAANLDGVLEIARARHEPVLLMTFATWVPPGYSQAAFTARTLDYTLHLSPIEMWGTPANVAAAVARHNEIVRDVAARDGTLRLVDQERAMPKGRRWFNDVCHLTSAGSRRFVANMLPAVVEALRRDDAGPVTRPESPARRRSRAATATPATRGSRTPPE